MFNPILMKILLTAFTYGICGSLAAAAMRLFNRDKSGPRLDQSAAVGFLVGAGFGVFLGIFQSMMLSDLDV